MKARYYHNQSKSVYCTDVLSKHSVAQTDLCGYPPINLLLE